MDKTLEILYKEHEYIMQAIDYVRSLKPRIKEAPAFYSAELEDYLDFFKSYADNFHHFKEEEILFPEMAKKNELLNEGVIKEMLENHADFRIMLGEIAGSLKQGRLEDAHSGFEKYSEALLDHIAVENDEVFQMAETLFSEDELEKMYYKFQDCDRDLGEVKKKEMEEKVS